MRIAWPLSPHFVLKNYGVDKIDDVFEMGQETTDLPLEEKNTFEQGVEGASFG